MGRSGHKNERVGPSAIRVARSRPYAGTRVSITPDKHAITRLYDDRDASQSVYTGGNHWNVDRLLDRSVTPDSPGSFEEMLPLWAGAAALRPVDVDRVRTYRRFLEGFSLDRDFDTWIQYIRATVGELYENDLKVLQDVLLLEKYALECAQRHPDRKIVILEIGGGYGPIADWLLSRPTLNVCYVLVDAVPESVFYQWAYLNHQHPESTIGSSFNGDPLATDRFDAYILPAWQLDRHSNLHIDVAVNIASIQEMTDDVAAAYFQLVRTSLRIGGIFYFQNSRDYLYQREYEVPSDWKYLIKRDTPRSRTLDFPLDLLEKTDCDQAIHNNALELAYYRNLKKKYERMLEKQEITIKNLQKIRANSAAKLTAALSAQTKRTNNMQTKLRSTQEQLASAKDLIKQLKQQ